MDYGNLISRSVEYTKGALWGEWVRWVILVVLSLIQIFTLFLIPFYNGYLVRVLSGRRPAPDVDDWARLFIDGWKWNIITLIYLIPTILVLIFFGVIAAISLRGAGMNNPDVWAGSCRCSPASRGPCLLIIRSSPSLHSWVAHGEFLPGVQPQGSFRISGGSGGGMGSRGHRPA